MTKSADFFVAFTTKDERNIEPQLSADLLKTAVEATLENVVSSFTSTKYVDFISSDANKQNVINEVVSLYEDDKLDEHCHLAKVTISISVELLQSES